jgi:carbon-monoxide dehydrogenase medium subunit
MAVVIYRLQDDGAIAESRIAIGGAEAVPRRLVEAEYALKGRQPTSDSFMLAAEIAAKMIEPLDDQHISAAYRRDLVLALVPRALEQARDRAAS